MRITSPVPTSTSRLLGVPGPLSVAPYEVEHTKGSRFFLWLKDDVEPGAKLGMRGFTACSHPGKWVGPGILVRYGEGREQRPMGMDNGRVAELIRWVDAGAGKCDGIIELKVVPRPLVCANPACAAADDSTRPKFQRCSRCQMAFYCSKECQVVHWRTGHASHKHACVKP
jgi:hypothetical protein